ncbi:MAG: hypothetical protein WCJ56_16415, partial [bacterium]
RNHSIFGHFALAFALLSPFVALLHAGVVLYLSLFEMPHYIEQIMGFIVFFALLPLECIILGIMAILFGRKERRKWLITEGVVAIIVGPPLSLIWYWPWLYRLIMQHQH